mmetsp:Transcript_15805/g.23188  ORF Transcript_15805/g.23188 Transcript_15805/m.23188 type:complete len:264 (-) Transcript_15805:59-850(-)
MLHHIERLCLRLVQLGSVHTRRACAAHLHLLLHGCCIVDLGGAAHDKGHHAADAHANEHVPREGRHKRHVERLQIDTTLCHALELERERERDLDHDEARKEVADDAHHDHLRQHHGKHALLLLHHHRGIGHAGQRVLFLLCDSGVQEHALVLVRVKGAAALEGGLGNPRGLLAHHLRAPDASHFLCRLDLTLRRGVHQPPTNLTQHSEEDHDDEDRQQHPVSDASVQHDFAHAMVRPPEVRTRVCRLHAPPCCRHHIDDRARK